MVDPFPEFRLLTDFSGIRAVPSCWSSTSVIIALKSSDMFVTIAGQFSFFHKDLKKSSKEIASLLDLDRIMKYERYELG